MTSNGDSAQALLEAAYSDLDFDGGNLLQATDVPGDMDQRDWVTRGGWLSLARKLKADRVFFVGGNPVVVFVKDEPGRQDLRKLFNRAWCMARPPLLFVAQPAKLSVFDLTRPPVETTNDPSTSDRLLKATSSAAEVQTTLKDYHRANIESGKLFEEQRFGLENRADRALIRDLALVRNQLLASGMSIQHAHALIGQSIFIRYLEDRRILTPLYFRRLASGNEDWRRILDSAATHDGSKDERRLCYAAVLSDRSFAHALFSQLAHEFNGDLFPFGAGEQRAFTASRLRIMRRFLLGQIRGPMLFSFAYDFDIIPIELISSMYEEFLRTEKGKPNTHGSYYTPGALVDFVLSQTLDEDILATRPRVLDPSCGSAIFLVEVFRRIVRHRLSVRRQRLRSDELRKILREQIAGIDVQPEAIRVAAFSLYLALLHYLEPPDILGHRLPNLVYSATRNGTDPRQHFDILVAANAFDVETVIGEQPIRDRFSSECADVVVGNPPWGTQSTPNGGAQQAAKIAMKWCLDRNRMVGDKELSQAFVHRSQDFLRPGGRAGLLLSTGVFFKRHNNSKKFREQWLASSEIKAVVNFAAVRDVFFKKAIAPFASVVFNKRPPNRQHRFHYYSAKKTAIVDGLRAVVLSKPDLHAVSQFELSATEELWKVYWWGGHRDEALLQALRLEQTLGSLTDCAGSQPERIGQGLIVGNRSANTSPWLRKLQELPTDHFERYGCLPTSRFVSPPSRVERERTPELYQGRRLLIKRGITQQHGANGRIVARLETEPFCFRNSINCFKLDHMDELAAKAILGIVWSSITRYYLWITSGSWGMWHHELGIDTLKRIPVRLPSDSKLSHRIANIVDQLRSAETTSRDIFAPSGHQTRRGIKSKIQKLEVELDEAVFDLFELTVAERDVVRDMCNMGLDLFYRGTNSKAVQPILGQSKCPSVGYQRDLPQDPAKQRGLDGYLDAFLSVWNAELNPGAQFRWRMIRSSEHSPMIAVIFSTEDPDDPLPSPADSEDVAWHSLLHELNVTSSHNLGSNCIYIDGMTRVVGATDIVIIKKNEHRLWTRTAGREDAEATQLQAIYKQRTVANRRAV